LANSRTAATGISRRFARRVAPKAWLDQSRSVHRKFYSTSDNLRVASSMDGSPALPAPKLRAVIDRDLFHHTPGRIAAGDVVEFSERR
jgi:hypothetical protein